MGPSFFQTIMGRQFFEGTLPSLVAAAKDLATAIRANAEASNRLAAAIEASAKKETP